MRGDKCMKKFLAILLSICSVLQFTAFAEGETPSAETATETVAETVTETEGYVLSDADKEKLDFMQKVGVLTGITQDDISSDKTITRGEFAKLAVELYNDVYDSYANDKSAYSDVDAGEDHYNAVSLLHELGIISGYGDGSFVADNNVTVNEAIKIITSVMGYKTIAETNGGYPGGYMKAASQCELFDGVKVADATKALTVSQLIPIIYNALDADPLIKISYGANGVQYEMTDDETLLSVYFDIYKARGTVTGNEYTSLLGKAKAGLNCVVIDGYQYYDADNVADGYIGYKVDYYYRATEDRDELVWLKPDKNCKIVEFSTDDILTESTTAYSIGYYDGSRKRVLQLKEDVTVIYNGVEYSGFTADLFKNADGSMTAISWENKSEYDVLIVEDYNYYVVDQVDVANYIIRDKFGKFLDIEEDWEDIIFVNEDGNPATLEDLKEWDAIAEVKSMNGEYWKLMIVKNSVEGEISSFSLTPNSDRVLGTIVVDGTEYEISKDYAKGAKENSFPLEGVRAGVNGYIVMDKNGKVILIDVNADSYKFGILKKVVQGEGEMGAIALIYDAKGQHVKFNLADRVNIDGKSVKVDEFANLITALQQGNVISHVTTAEKTANPDWASLLPENNVFQLVRYALDEDETQIVKFDTAHKEAEDEPEGLRLMYDVDTSKARGASFQYKTATGFLSNVIVPGNAPIFFVPSPLQIGADESYAIKDRGYFANDGSYTMLPYGTDEDSDAGLDAIVMIDSYKTNVNSASLFIVSKIYTAVHGDDVVTAIDGYKKKQLETVYLADNCECANLDIKDIKVGDIIQFGKNSADRVNAIQRIYDNELRDLTDLGKQYLSEAQTNVSRRYMCSGAYKYSDGNLSVSNVYIGNNQLERRTCAEIQKGDLIEKVKVANFNNKYGIFVFENDEVKMGSASDIKTYDMYGDDCSIIVTHTGYNEANTMFIFNYQN